MHLYIHVPFCARRCSYCDFSIAVRRVVPDAAFVETIRAEWAQRVHQMPNKVHTLYFGGGTPSRLAPASIAALIELVGANARLDPSAEITIEANPDDITDESAHAWARAGVNRVSLGVQTHDPAVLEWMHRTHRANQVAPATESLRAAGITNISMDLIFAVPSHLGRDWSRDVDTTLALEPSHVSLYGLTIEPRTPLARWAGRGEVVPAGDDRYAAEYLALHDALRSAGYEHYEVSNAALPGMRSRHNSAYWGAADYVGLGPSAHSFVGGVRSWNVRDWEAYRAAVASGGPVEEGSEALTSGQAGLERRYLGLRTTAGLPADALPLSAVRQWTEAGWAAVDGGRVVLTPEGWLRLDALVAGLGDS